MSVPNEGPDMKSKMNKRRTEVLGRKIYTDIYRSLHQEILLFPFSIIFSINYVVFY